MKYILSLITIFTVLFASAQTAEILDTRTLIARTAITGLTASWTEHRPYFCSRFVRQVMQKAIPAKANELSFKYFGVNAYETESKWQRMGKLRPYNLVKMNGGLREGDLVFQPWSKDGHVGIVVKKNGVLMIAENTVRYGMNRRDFRALTTLAKFGTIRSVGRYTGFNF